MNNQLESPDELVERALSGVRLVICEHCKGFGIVGLASFSCECAKCKGSGRTTTTEEADEVRS